VWFQKISIPTPWMVIENSEGVEGLKRPKFLKESIDLNRNFQGGGFKVKAIRGRGMDIFWNHTQRLSKLFLTLKTT